jgi:hypothetical protein
MRMLTSPALLVLVLGARGHIKNYWTPRDGKNATRIPLPKMHDYNEAARQTEKLLQVLEYLEYSWVLTSFINGMGEFERGPILMPCKISYADRLSSWVLVSHRESRPYIPCEACRSTAWITNHHLIQ